MTYSNVANSLLVSQIVLKQSGAIRMTTTKNNDNHNRLINLTAFPAGAQMRLDFGYDQQSRRTSKNVVIAGVTNAQKFVYDGWNEQATLNYSFAVGAGGATSGGAGISPVVPL